MTEMRGLMVATNSLPTPLKLVIEPWANEATIAPGHSMKVEFSGPQSGRIEIEVKEGVLVIYGWTGSVLSDPMPEDRKGR
jgi:hypothetical protein